MTDRELMQMALDALANFDLDVRLKVIPALRAALSQPEPEPVAYWDEKAEVFCMPPKDGRRPFVKAWKPLYTAPPQREWQGLTLDEIFDSTHGFTRIQKNDWVATDTDIAEFAHIIEARLKAKNT